MKLKYAKKRFGASALAIISAANEIIEEYAAQGFDLTLRQLYYVYVSRGLIANRQSEYKRLGSIVNDARLAGLIDWSSIVDRTRGLEALATWEKPADIVSAAAKQFRHDLWADQPTYVEAWIEKDALSGVLQSICEPLRVPYLSCRGYTSQSEMWSASQRLLKKLKDGKRVVVLHLGDHDPSGLDMTRDITDRLRTFLAVDLLRYLLRSRSDSDKECVEKAHTTVTRNFEVTRLALNMDQVEEYKPPPNPAKTTDARFRRYEEEYGDESWELDALEPAVLRDLVTSAVEAQRDAKLWRAAEAREAADQKTLDTVVKRWDDAVRATAKK